MESENEVPFRIYRRGWAHNPYAIASIAVGERNHGEQVTNSAKRVAEILRADNPDDLARSATARNPVPTVLHLFDAVPGVERGFASWEAAVEQVVRAQPAAGAVVERFRTTAGGMETLRRIVPYLVPIKNDAPGSGSERAPKILDWRTTDAAKRPFDLTEGAAHEEVDFRDPVQFGVADCYLLSAISAIAWTYPADWQQRVEQASQAPAGRRRFGFYSTTPDRRFAEVPVDVTENVPWDAGGFAYAHSREPLEAWPALYEKAFLCWTYPYIDRDKPSDAQYQRLGQKRQYPDEAAAQLMRLKLPDLSRKRYEANPQDMLAALQQPAVTTRGTDGDGLQCGLTRVPTMAWTYNGDDGKYGKAEADYKLESYIAANHAYAVLGWRKDALGNTWIMLRNPWGQSQAPIPAADYMTGIWNTGRTNGWPTAVPLNEEGVFGLAAETFSRAFKVIAWCPPE